MTIRFFSPSGNRGIPIWKLRVYGPVDRQSGNPGMVSARPNHRFQYQNDLLRVPPRSTYSVYIYMVSVAICKFTTKNDKSICGSYSTHTLVWVP